MNPRDHNPFQAPAAHEEPTIGDAAAEIVIRKAHLKHETSIKATGKFLFLIGAGCVSTLLFIVYVQLSSPRLSAPIGLLMMLAVISGLAFFVGRGMISLQPWARRAAIVLCFVGLLVFPAGTVICSYLLYLLLSDKGRTVFTDEYRRVIQQTADVRFPQRNSDALLLLAAILAVMTGWFMLI